MLFRCGAWGYTIMAREWVWLSAVFSFRFSACRRPAAVNFDICLMAAVAVAFWPLLKTVHVGEWPGCAGRTLSTLTALV